MSEQITVRMLGGFSLEYGGHRIDDKANRMKKVWLLLAYLICSRNTRVTQDNLLSLLHGDADDDALDPSGKLKAVLYRLRNMLDGLGELSGHDLIVRKNGSYAWNTQFPIHLDIDEFEDLCKQAAAQEDAGCRLELYRKALALYEGDFLPKLNMEPWVMPICAYYHRMFLDAAEQALRLMQAQERWEESAALCRKALKIEPYSEPLYQHLMQSLIATDEKAAAVQIYEDMSELLFSNFGVMPSEESRKLYRDASKSSSGQTVAVDAVKEGLREQDAPNGALYCEYDFFRFLYQLQARSIIRSGEVIHIVLFSLHGKRNSHLPRRSLDIAMDNLQELILGNLRQGDVVTRCSVSQLLVMLPQANYENSCAVCDRIIRAFYRKYPHSPADIHHSVQPLEPSVGGRD